MIFETHAHYDDEKFDEDRDALLSSMKGNGIEYIVNVSSDWESLNQTILLMKEYSFVYGALGIHPSDCAKLTEEDIWKLQELCKNDKTVAIGEIGLDYYWPEPNHELQKKWFARQLELAREVKLPIIVHSRDAARDTLDIMRSEKAEEIGGVIHCFSYSKEIAEQFLSMGYYIGVGGVITFKNAKKLKEVVEFTPLSSIVLETDSPYLSPEPYRGKRNSSLYLPYVAEEIARIKGIDMETVYQTTYENARNLYRLSKINEK